MTNSAHLVMATVVLLFLGFLGGIGAYETYGEPAELQDYCKSQDIQMTYNGSIQATEQGLIIECANGDDVERIRLTAEEPETVDANWTTSDWINKSAVYVALKPPRDKDSKTLDGDEE